MRKSLWVEGFACKVTTACCLSLICEGQVNWKAFHIFMHPESSGTVALCNTSQCWQQRALVFSSLNRIHPSPPANPPAPSNFLIQDYHCYFVQHMKTQTVHTQAVCLQALLQHTQWKIHLDSMKHLQTCEKLKKNASNLPSTTHVWWNNIERLRIDSELPCVKT